MLPRDDRPVFLNLWQIRMPVAALMSFAHRASGVLLVLTVPALLYWLQLSVSEADGFLAARDIFESLSGKFALFFLAWAFLHHLLAGLRYLFIDMDAGVEKHVANYTAWMVLMLAPLLSASLVYLV